MSERTDQKLEEIAVARYSYRHDAEFAAGFLADAEIPHRLQLDDPGIGVSLGSMATIWVLAMDARRARELLEVEDGPVSLTRRGSHPRGPGRTSGSPPMASSRLGGRARAIALLLCGGILSMGALFLTGASPPILRAGVAVASAGFAMMGVTGRAPAPLNRFLHAVSGNAP